MKEHLTELLLILVLVLLLGFVILQSHWHNDQAAAKGMDFIYGDLGALWGLTQKSTSEKVGQPVAAILTKDQPKENQQ